MKIINLIIAIVLSYIMIFWTVDHAVVPIMMLVDPVSFIFVIIVPYFLTAYLMNTNNLYKNDIFLNKYGSLAFIFGFIQLCICLVVSLANIAQSPPYIKESVASMLAIGIIAVLYGTITKYILMKLLK